MSGKKRLVQNQFFQKVPVVAGACIVVALTACSNDSTPSCSELATLYLPDIHVLDASRVEAAEELPSHCRVHGVVGSAVQFELLLPDDWNGKFVMGGGGGFVGRIANQAQNQIYYRHGGTPLERGYATVGTDTGHKGTRIDASWAYQNLERKLNFGYRAVHSTAVAAKSLINEYYGKPPAYSYFMGCSRGGGQGMMESQLFPTDFDGIVSGAPAFDWNGLAAGFVYGQQTMYPDPHRLDAPVVTAENRALLATSIVEQCDALDGVEDGVLEDPRRCEFEPTELPICPNEKPAPECLTKAQLEAVMAIYKGANIAGQQLYPGFPFGGESDVGGWDMWITGGSNTLDAIFGGEDLPPNAQFALGTEAFKYLLTDDPDWDYASYDFSNFEDDTAFGASYLNATDTDLSSFQLAGGKLLMWHGWSDTALSSLSTIRYYEAVKSNDPQVQDYFRLFMMPGVLHCQGGPGPDCVDWLDAIEAWVERGEAPERLVASRLSGDGAVEKTRPLCPYPEVAVYNGSGDTHEADSFRCEVPEP
jgi:feruloyl esterase